MPESISLTLFGICPLFCTGVEPINNAVMVSGAQQSHSVIHIRVLALSDRHLFFFRNVNIPDQAIAQF